MADVDKLLNEIITSINATKTSVEELIQTTKSTTKTHPELIDTLLSKTGTKQIEGVSLLSLKNQALASYVTNLALVVLGQIERISQDEEENGEKHRLEAIKRTIVQRVCLEKGVKPLEKKINYQLDKMVRAYGRMEADEAKIEEKLHHKSGSEDDEDEEEEGDNSEDEESEDDNLAYRPDAAALAKLAPKSTKTKSTSALTTESNEKYKPPKISAMAPPSAIRDIDAKDKSNKNRKLQSMEEYLNEQSDMPSLEASIGSTIVDHGRGGVKTQHDRNKEREIQTYEESNFIRLPQNQTKKSFKQKQRDMANQFAGEDWSIFNNDRSISSTTSRKRKPGSVWDRVKKKRT
ncbi:uncharacterized protein J8A68_004657 [[Candida] subhashii]|uniref:Uncharacterized protein n=1 Tax=[Candida] subhashii TaxID=561895 RepID=A0A8J5UKB4_9ASCO|nr:uncharacterized protein J8A68_004657 [[Candida] subhashii]KAG7661831.1 hypothetical protein J8A68_004657 [[Candida] subhashii]